MTAPAIDLAAVAARFGTAPAASEGDRTLGYAALAEVVAERAAAFGHAGIGPGTRTGLLCPPGIDTLVSALALLRSGTTLVPLAGETTTDELMRVVGQCKVGWVVRGSEPSSTGEPAGGSPDAALGFLSSGSTGTPKLVLRSMRQVRAAAEIYVRSVELTAADRVLALVPLEHAYGFTNVLLGSLLAGATIVFPGTTHPRAVTDLVRSARITLLPAPPRFLDLMVKFSTGERAPLPHLRAAVSVGTALATRVHAVFTETFGVPLWQSYGASECGPVCLNQAGTPDGEVVALGTPCPGVKVSIRDPEGHELPDGEIGEIVIASPAVGIGYEGEHDGASRIAPGMFHSGDLGCRQDGIVRFRGRLKLLIAAAGHKVDPVEVEEVLRRHPGITDAAVVAHRGEDGVETVKAIIVAAEPPSLAEITDFCARHLSPWKLPRLLECRPALPRNAMGKLLRERL
jgi:long-chain acyl-CoA synthetase